MDLQKIRAAIDSIDSEIIRLLSKRIECAIRTKRFKDSVTDPSREQEILQRISAKSKGLITPEFSTSIFSTIMQESRRLQSVGMQLIGFQGEHGSAVEFALSQHNNTWVPIPCTNYSEIFEGIKTGALDFGIVPIQNATEESVTPVIELLIGSDVAIDSELNVPVHYCLLTLPEYDYRDIKVVYSTADALAHCKEFLGRHRFEGRPYYDAAGAAMMLARDKIPGASVIAHASCAEVYGLQILKENVGDHDHSNVRYLVLTKAIQTHGSKTTASFAVKHEAGSLLKILQIFANNGINLTRIESCTNPADSSLATFLIDFEGASDSAAVQAALKEIKGHTVQLKLFGSYTAFEISEKA